MNIATPPYPGAGGPPGNNALVAPPGAGTPLEGAAAVFDMLLPGVPSPGTPGSATSGPWDLVPKITIPQIPGMPVPLPTELKMPSDGLCAGTGGLWSATTTPGASPASAATPAGDRRDDW